MQRKDEVLDSSLPTRRDSAMIRSTKEACSDLQMIAMDWKRLSLEG